MTTAAKYEVRFDRAQNLLLWSLRGFWSMADLMPFAAAMRAAIEPLGPPPLLCEALCDARDFPVQSVEVSEALGRINDAGRSFRKGRTAIVVGSMMNKLQVQRTLDDDDMRIFLSLADAFAWLGKKAPSQ